MFTIFLRVAPSFLSNITMKNILIVSLLILGSLISGCSDYLKNDDTITKQEDQKPTILPPSAINADAWAVAGLPFSFQVPTNLSQEHVTYTPISLPS